MAYIYTMKQVNTDSIQVVRDALIVPILENLKKGKKVLFLASGGSTASIAVETCEALRKEFPSPNDTLSELFTVSLVDERFGPPGHSDSNWQRLRDSGFTADYCKTMPVLRKGGSSEESMEKTVARFITFLQEAARANAEGNLFVAALFGIGSDGHTAGILPESQASLMGTAGEEYATGYASTPFARITITPQFFPFIDLAVAYASGKEKKDALDGLQQDKSAREQPAQLLKLAKHAIVFAHFDKKVT